MSDEQTAPVEQTVDTKKLEAELDAMRRKNAELLDEYKKISTQIKNVPDGVDIQELIDFKHKAEQSKLESEGKYTEARQALEQQFREASAEKDKRIAELEEDADAYARQVQQLKQRNADLLERERRRRGA